MEASCCEYTSSEFTRNVRQVRRNNPHSSNCVVKQTCRHYLRHIRNAINQKDGRERRGMCDRNYKSIGPQQIRPADFNEALKSPSFKTELPTFLQNEWKEQAYAHNLSYTNAMCMLAILANVHTSSHFFVDDGVVRHDTIVILGCNHAEADTRICLHTKVIDDAGNDNNVIIRASDTDFAVIMLHHAWIFSATLWMDTGTTNGKN